MTENTPILTSFSRYGPVITWAPLPQCHLGVTQQLVEVLGEPEVQIKSLRALNLASVLCVHLTALIYAVLLCNSSVGKLWFVLITKQA